MAARGYTWVLIKISYDAVAKLITCLSVKKKAFHIAPYAQFTSIWFYSLNEDDEIDRAWPAATNSMTPRELHRWRRSLFSVYVGNLPCNMTKVSFFVWVIDCNNYCFYVFILLSLCSPFLSAERVKVFIQRPLAHIVAYYVCSAQSLYGIYSSFINFLVHLSWLLYQYKDQSLGKQ